MEKEKTETISETKEGFDSEPGMKHSGDDKPVLEALPVNVSAGHDDEIGKIEVVKDENDTDNPSLKAAGEGKVDEGVSSKDHDKDSTVDCCEVPADAHIQPEEKNVTVQSTKATSIGCIGFKLDTPGVENGETAEVTGTNDNALSTEDKVPVSTSQSSQPSQAVTSVSGSCSNGTSTQSTFSTTRSTRSQNPEFLARHRSFLHKLHLASSSNITDEELYTDDDESTTSKTTSRSSGSVQTEDTSSLIADSVSVRRKRERSASNGTMSPRIPSPSVSSMIGGSASANNSGSSSPAGSQMQPATKKRRNTRTDSAGAQQQSPVATPLPAVGSSTDQFCWLCHKDGVVINCETCPRVYHLRCIQLEVAPTEDWVCPECITILHAENTDTRSRAMKLLSLDQLCNLLKYAVSRMKTYSGAEPFWKAVDVTEFPQYREYVAHPMDLSLLERNIKKKMYGSTEAFVADTKWILHNCIIFNTYQSRLTGIAKVLLKICKQEMSEIENCPDCYLNAHIRKDSWFIEVCRKPHILVWAKLKGFPFWPAKVMRTNKEGMVDVRFFGAHDRAWVPIRECFLYSKAIPASARNKKRNNLDACIAEVEQHTRKLRDKFGVFEHAPFRTHFDPSQEREQLHMLLPSYDDGGGQPSSKRSKLLGGGYTVRTYQRSQQSNREAQERKKIKTYETEELNATVESDKSGDRSSRTKKRKLWDGDGCSDNEKRAGRSYKRTASGSGVSRQNSSSSSSSSSRSSSSSEDSQESDDGTRQDRGSSVDAEGSGKSASLIEWSRFEESAAKLSAAVEGGGSDDDKQSITSENRKLRDGDDSRDSVLPCNDANVRKEGTSTETSKVEKCASVPAEVVKKVLVSPSIADKLQEKLLRLQRSSKEFKDAEDASSEGISGTMSEEQTMENKTEKDSKSFEDCETLSVGVKESEGMTNFNLEMSSHDKTRKPEDGESRREENNDLSGLQDESDKRERSESPVVNKTPLRAEPKCYGKKYLPRVVLHNLVLSPGKILAGKIRGVTGNIVSDQKLLAAKAKHFLLPAGSKQDQEISPKEQQTCKITSVEDNRKTSCPESLLKNRLEVSSVYETCTSYDSETSDQNLDVDKKDSNVNPEIFPCSFISAHEPNVVGSDKLQVVQNCGPTDVYMKNVMSDNSSESGDGDIVMDFSKRTPEHGYSKCSYNDGVFENGAKTVNSSKVQDTETIEQAEAIAENDVTLDGHQLSLSATEHTQEKSSVLEPAQEIVKDSEASQCSAEDLEGSNVGTECLSKEVTASDIPPGDRAAVFGSQSKTVVISSSISDSGNADLNPVQNRSESEPLTEEENTSAFSGAHNVGKAAYQESDLPNAEVSCTGDDKEHSVSSSNSPKDNCDVSLKLSIPHTAVLKVYPAKTNKALDKKMIDSKMSELNKSELFWSDVTVTPTAVVSACAEKEVVADRADTSVVSASAEKEDVADRADTSVVRSCAEKGVVADRADTPVVSACAEKEVVADRADTPVVSACAEKEVVADRADTAMVNASAGKEDVADRADTPVVNASAGREDVADRADTPVVNASAGREDVSDRADTLVVNASAGKENVADRADTSVVGASAEREDVADKADTTTLKATDGFSIFDKKIKEEPLDPDELVAESSTISILTLPSCESLAKTSPELTRQKGADGDKFNKGKINLNKKLTVSLLDDKDRLASNDSPSSLSEKDGIFPSLFLDPSITITVINDKQSETAEAPLLGRSKVGSGDINVSELRASVNLSKDISLTVVGAGYDEHNSSSAKGLSGPVTSLDMDCDHESENDSRNSSTNATSGLVPVTVQNSMTRQNNTNKQKKVRPSSGSETLQARSRARKSFPNRPVFTNVKGKSHPELVNGVGAFGNKLSTQRRNSSGTNSNSSDSRRNSYATSPQEMLISTQQAGDTITENFGGNDNNNNNPGSAMVVLPPMLGNPTTNHIQALRAVNSNIGSPSHIVNSGPDMIPSRMMQVPHNQTHPVGSGTKISPAGQGHSRMPPQLQPRPPGPLLSQHPPSVPSEAGPMSAELNRHVHKLSDFLRTTVEEILRDLSNIGSPAATIKSLQIELEKLQWRHNQEMSEMKHNTDLIVMEMRASMESERQRAIAETIRQCELEKQRAVEETKKKQWCTNCGKEALFYCCWNTSYCDYPCQQRHWPHHMSTCAQNSQQGSDGSAREGDMVQRSSPQTSGGSGNHTKPIPSQQQQPWLDSKPVFKPATSSAGNLSSLSYHGLCNNKTGSPSPSVTDQVGDEDYDSNNNNRNDALQPLDQRQEIEKEESSNLKELSGMNMVEHRLPKKRKRCGKCSGCMTVGNCGQCPPCNSTRTHQVCRQRRCSNLLMETALSVSSSGVKRSHINVQQKLHQVVSNGPIGGKPPVGPPPSYSGTVLAQAQRNVGASVGRVPTQYAGLLPMARPANIQGPHMLPTYAMYPGDPRGAGLAALQQQQRLMGSQFPPRHPHMGFTVRPPHYFL